MEDHQTLGNLAMGGSSGPYLQGASLGQWIQQITVGGSTVADGTADFASTKPAYNDVSRLFIRASGRQPLNAPFLSLRTRKDIPDDILEEAAHALLSGGRSRYCSTMKRSLKGFTQWRPWQSQQKPGRGGNAEAGSELCP